MEKLDELIAFNSPLAAKIVLMMSEVSHIPKTGHNSAQNYDYATEADTVAACRKALIKHGVALKPSLKEKSYTPITSKQGATGFLVSVTMTYTLTDAESGESTSFDMPGDGMDYGDKGIYKAMTGAEKYALLKLFHLPTGDDPEKESHDLGTNRDAELRRGEEQVREYARAISQSVVMRQPLDSVEMHNQPEQPGGTYVLKIGRQKGQPVSDQSDENLQWVLDYYMVKLKDPINSSSRFRHEWEEAVLAIEEERARR